MDVMPINSNNWSMLVVDRDDLFLPKGWITAISPIGHRFTDYEKNCGIWKIIDIPTRPYSAVRPLIKLGDNMTPDVYMYQNGSVVKKDESVQEIINIQLAKNPKPLPIPNHLDRSQSTIWDYGPGRTYSTPQAAYNALYASVGLNNFTEKHYIRGWSGTYGVTGSYVLYFNPAVIPNSRTNILICDVETGETVIWDGEGAAAVLFGNAVEHVKIDGVKFGNATYGIYPVAWNANLAVEDWYITSCEGDGTLGTMTGSFVTWGITDLIICYCYSHDLAAGGSGVTIGRKANRTESFDVKFGNNRIESPYGLFMTSAYTTCVFGNTFKNTISGIHNNMGIDGSLGFVVNNIFYGAPGSACNCIAAAGINSWQLIWLNADGNCYYPGDTGGAIMTLADQSISDLATLQSVFGKDPNSIESDPLIDSDLDLQALSPCKRAGVCTPYDGYNGIVRGPNVIDIGAQQVTVGTGGGFLEKRDKPYIERVGD